MWGPYSLTLDTAAQPLSDNVYDHIQQSQVVQSLHLDFSPSAVPSRFGDNAKRIFWGPQTAHYRADHHLFAGVVFLLHGLPRRDCPSQTTAASFDRLLPDGVFWGCVGRSFCEFPGTRT